MRSRVWRVRSTNIFISAVLAASFIGLVMPTSAQAATGGISPIATESGKISLSVDGLGTTSTTGSVQVDKPTGATVRKAYLSAATTGFSLATLTDGDVQLNGQGVVFTTSVPSGIDSTNYWADVTSLVKSTIDGSPAGTVNLAVGETDTDNVDGEVLAVIFDDPGQAVSNTIVLLFGAQQTTGDTFAIGLADPINKADPNLKLDLSLGISYSFQGTGQYSQIDVNGQRLTTAAGGQDDGEGSNGALLTVGGIGDSNANPADPDALPDGDPRFDDELYSLLPFVSNGDTSIDVNTLNPSNDDNIFFAALRLNSTTAIVGEGIVLSPASSTNPVGTSHTVTATVQDDNGAPVANRNVTFTVVSGPHAGTTGVVATNAQGKANFSYVGTTTGLDTIHATFVDSQAQTRTSNDVTKQWTSDGGGVIDPLSVTIPPNSPTPVTFSNAHTFINGQPVATASDSTVAVVTAAAGGPGGSFSLSEELCGQPFTCSGPPPTGQIVVFGNVVNFSPPGGYTAANAFTGTIILDKSINGPNGTPFQMAYYKAETNTFIAQLKWCRYNGNVPPCMVSMQRISSTNPQINFDVKVVVRFTSDPRMATGHK